MRTWDEVSQRLDYFLDDEDSENRTFEDRLRVNAWNWAQEIFVAHTPLSKSCTLNVLADTRTGRLPADFYAMDMLYDSSEDRWWWPMRRRPGDVRYDDDDVLEYWLWGGELKLEQATSVGSTHLTLYYWAYYPDVEYTVDSDGVVTIEQGQILTPKWAEVALLHLAAAHCMAPGEVQSAYLDGWKTRQDSGNPIQNPRLESVKFHLSVYDDLIGRFPRAPVGRSG